MARPAMTTPTDTAKQAVIEIVHPSDLPKCSLVGFEVAI
jgi:hypothetical protein